MSSYDPKEFPDTKDEIDASGTYLMRVLSARRVEGKNGDPRLIANVFCVVKEPETFSEAKHGFRFYLGTQDDPEAENPETRQRYPFKQGFMKLVRAAGIAPSGNVESDLAQLKGSEFVVVLAMKNGTDANGNDTQNLDYKGFYPAGSRTPLVKAA